MSVTCTEFQSRCIRECEEILDGMSGIHRSNFVRLADSEDSYYKLSISGGQHYLQVYIYAEEAGYRIDGTHWMGFDRAVYPSQDALVHSFRESLRGALFTLTA